MDRYIAAMTPFSAFLGRAALREVAGNTFWQITDKLLRAVLGLVVGIWVARYLGPADFGLLNFSIAFAALFAFSADLGLQAIVVRELVWRKEARMRIVASALALRSLGAGVAVVLSVIFIRFMRADDELSYAMTLVMALAFFPQALDVIDFDYQARMRSRPIVVIRSISLLVFSIAKVGLILSGAQLITFAWMVVGEAGMSAVLMWTLFKMQAPAFTVLDASYGEMKHLLSHSWPLAIAGLSVILYMRIDQVMLGRMLNNEAVGIFSAAVRVSESWYFIPMAILAAVAPTLTAAHRDSEQSFQRKLVFCLRMVLFLSIAAAVALTVSSNWIILFLFGSGYSDAAPLLAIHAWAGVFASLGVATGPWFVNSGMLKFRMIHTMVGAFANVGLNLYMIPRFGATGAAVSTLISYSIAAFWLNAVSGRTRPVFFLQAKSLFMR